MRASVGLPKGILRLSQGPLRRPVMVFVSLLHKLPLILAPRIFKAALEKLSESYPKQPQQPKPNLRALGTGGGDWGPFRVLQRTHRIQLYQ